MEGGSDGLVREQYLSNVETCYGRCDPLGPKIEIIVRSAVMRKRRVSEGQSIQFDALHERL